MMNSHCQPGMPAQETPPPCYEPAGNSTFCLVSVLATLQSCHLDVSRILRSQPEQDKSRLQEMWRRLVLTKDLRGRR